MNAARISLSRCLVAFASLLTLTMAANPASADPLVMSAVYDGRHIFPRTQEQYEAKANEYRQLLAQVPTMKHYQTHGNPEQKEWARQIDARGRQLAGELRAHHTFLTKQVLPTKLVCYNSGPPAKELDRFFTLLRRDMGAQGKTYVWNGREFLVTDGQGRVVQVDQEIRQAAGALPQKQDSIDVDAIADKATQVANSHAAAATANHQGSASAPVSLAPLPTVPAGLGGSGLLGTGE